MSLSVAAAVNVAMAVAASPVMYMTVDLTVNVDVAWL
jgi:hypothetical protein